MLRLPLLIGSILLTFLAHGQAVYPVKAYTVNDGLIQGQIDDVITGSDGFMWIGTAGGLSRFDGYNFKTYRPHTGQPRSAPSERAYRFYIDREKRLWMVSFNGVSLYHSLTDDFTNIISYEPRTVVTSENRIFGEDDRYLWAGLNNYGLVRIDKGTLRPEKITISGLRQTEESESWHRGFMENRKLWIVTNQQFLICDMDKKTSVPVNIPAKGLISFNREVAVGFTQTDALIINKQTLRYTSVPIAADGSAHAVVTAVKISSREVLFCSSTRGLFYLDVPSGRIVRRVSMIDAGNGSQIMTASAAYRDPSGNLWVGSFGQGLYRFSYPYRKFKTYRAEGSESNSIYSLYVDRQNIYAGPAGNGIDVFSRENGGHRKVQINKDIPGMMNRAAVTHPIGGDNLFLIGYTTRAGDYNKPLVYNTRTNRASLMNSQVLDFYSKHWGPGNLRNFALPVSGTEVLTNAGKYLLSIKATGPGMFTASPVHQFNEMLSCAFRDRSGQVWVGTYKGLYVSRNGRWQEVSITRKIEIKTISQDNEGNIWAGTNYGIYVLDRNYRPARYYNEENHLVNEHVYGILPDADGNMWFSHNKGLSVYRKRKRVFQHYSEADGLQGVEFNAVASFRTPDGELFFGGINGTTAFYPQEVRDNPHAPAPVITSIQLFDEPYKTDTAHWSMRSLQLLYTQNSLAFEFTMPEFSRPEGNRYSYFMEGVDKAWSPAGTRRFARYPSIKPGNYRFRVKAANADGTWSREKIVSISITPPFWQRWWFIALAAVTGIALAVAAFSYFQKRRYRKKMRALEFQQKVQAERERISRDLHDNVGTQLSLISKSIEGIIHPGNGVPKADQGDSLLNISQTSKEVIATLRETIWALNKEIITLEEFSDKLKSYAQKQVKIYSDLQLEYREDEDADKIQLMASEAIHLFRICQEAIANSLKYSGALHLKIAVSVANGKYRIAITDDGKGFEQDSVSYASGYGLENMKFRANEISCELLIDSEPGRQTSILISQK